MPMSGEQVARRLEVEGIVQGVGFRPFVFQLAKRLALKGDVANTSGGVTINLEGLSENIAAFCRDLTEKSPPLAYITEVAVHPKPLEGFADFSIVQSRAKAARSTLISPDVSICDDCLRELFNPSDRRYRYPFINCTNCGPRYTIIDDIPYDRPKTSMRHFTMCGLCQAEYDDPENRRFHAQPNACRVCGPHVSLYDNRRQPIDDLAPIGKAAALLQEGRIIAVKGLGGFHLAADAENAEAVATLRKRKHREEKPFALMSIDLERIGSYAVIEPEDRSLLTTPQRPIVLLRKKIPNTIAGAVSPRNNYFGVMLPYTPLHYLLLEAAGATRALVMTSGNLSEEPIAIDNDDAFERLSGIADYFLIHNREIYLRSDDSITRRTAGKTRFIRRSRGYIPRPVFLNQHLPPILACGAELKNTVCLTKGNKAFVSQHIGDLENLATDKFFKMTVDHMKRILDVHPEAVAFDLHPDYLSTRYAEGLPAHVKKIQVQHHHAHIASCMAENKIDGPVIGLSFDGTGYGTDGTVWGGEVLVAGFGHFDRAAHLSCVAMPGSAAAIREPWRMGISYLYAAFGDRFRDLDLPVLKDIDEKKIRIVTQMIDQQVNAPLTSSLGRLFDGVSAIVGVRHHVHHEGQAAMELEMIADREVDAAYPYEWESADPYRILTAPIIQGVVRDMEKKTRPSVISRKFHNTVIRLFSDLCHIVRKDTGIGSVALSGGVFQNDLLLSEMIPALEKRDFTVYTHQHVPTNDGGISLGQAMVAAAIVEQ
jgi:hydrogenase maturation protein HypF